MGSSHASWEQRRGRGEVRLGICCTSIWLLHAPGSALLFICGDLQLSGKPFIFARVDLLRSPSTSPPPRSTRLRSPYIRKRGTFISKSGAYRSKIHLIHRPCTPWVRAPGSRSPGLPLQKDLVSLYRAQGVQKLTSRHRKVAQTSQCFTFPRLDIS